MEQKKKEPLQEFSENGKIGFKNEKGEVVVKPQFCNRAYYWCEDYLGVADENKKWGFINSLGDLAIPCIWTRVGGFLAGVADAMDDSGKWGVINKRGETVIPFQYSHPFIILEHKVLLLNENGHKIFMNRDGKIIHPQQLKETIELHEGLITIVDENEHYGFADENGEIVFPPKWDYALYFDDGYACVREGNDRYYMDHDGNLVPIHYDFPPTLNTKGSIELIKCLIIKSKVPVGKITSDIII